MTLLCPSWRTFLSLLVLPSIVLAYKWPNPQLDELESQRYDRMGYNARALSEGVIPCDQFLLGETVGRANAADWLRTVSTKSQADFDPLWLINVIFEAYHDMATHNVTSGTGGLDGSIRFEQDQPAVCRLFRVLVAVINSTPERRQWICAYCSTTPRRGESIHIP